MDNFDKIWKDRFNESEMGQEDWLKPSDGVFANISAAVLPTQPSRKRLAWFWWVLIGIGALTFIGIGYHLISKDSARGEITQSQTVKYATEKSITLDQNNIAETIDNKDFKVNSVSKTESTKQAIASTNIVKSKITHIKDITTNNKLTKSKTSTADDNSQVADNTPLIAEEAIALTTPINESIVDIKASKGSSASLESRTTILPIQNIKYTLDSDHLLIDIPSTFTRIEVEKEQIDNKGAFALHAQTGLAIQNAQLNDAFRNSLDNADFSSSAGMGYYAGLGLNIPISNKWSLTTDINYTHTTSVASHNANLGYDINRETADDHTNDYNIGMATPYGLIESNIVIGRSDALDSDLVSTVADVSSDQTIRAINITPSLVYNAYSGRFINLELKTGFGIEQILSVDNHIHDVMTNHNGLNYQQGEVIKTQDVMSINNTIGQATAGFNIGFKLSSSSMLLLGYEYQKALNPVFQMDDKKTFLNNQNIGIKFRINL